MTGPKTRTRAPPSPLRLRRVSLGLTLVAVARKLGEERARISNKTSVARWETGDAAVPPDVAPVLCRVLGVKRLPT